MKINNLGFTEQLEKEWQDKNPSFTPARVLTVNKNNYLIKSESSETLAELSGKMFYSIDSNSDLPAVGDWVLTQSFDEDSVSIIHEVLSRKSILKRKTSGKNIDFQVIAANIDTAFIIQADDFNLRRLERYLVMAKESKIEPVILLSKSDLFEKDEIEKRVEAIKIVDQNISVIPFSNTTGDDFEKIVNMIEPYKTYCLLGSSGVGKTTLLNKLIGNEEFAVNDVREKDRKGKHTTTRRQLTILENGGMIIDTPGMRELGNFDVESGIADTFDEIIELASKCLFVDCTHTHEKGCAVLNAIEEGSLDQGRYNNFIKMKKESDHYSRSYQEKRERDKEFGKMCKEVMKYKKRNKY